MRSLFWLVVLVMSNIVSANEHVDLELNMKNTGLAYKHAVQATSLEEFNIAIDDFITLVKSSKSAKFYKEAEKSVQGLNKVLVQAELAKVAANKQGLNAAKKPLKEIDNLRKKYHKLHEPPGFFELLFGK